MSRGRCAPSGMTRGWAVRGGIGKRAVLSLGLAVALVPMGPGPVASADSSAVRTIVVASPSDTGAGTLRQALLEARAGDTITFDPAIFPPTRPVTISLASALHAIVQGNLTIDASNAGVVLDGLHVTELSSDGLAISSSGNTIRGLQVVRFPRAGIALWGGAQHNTIGGDRRVGRGPLGQGNLVSGNGSFGIGLWDTSTAHNTTQGNIIGAGLDGRAWGNPRDGVHSNGPQQTVIADNVIAHNGTGVYVTGAGDTQHIIRGNRISHNRSSGVTIDRVGRNTIGPANTISDNGQGGVTISGPAALRNTITQNSIHDNATWGIELGAGGNSLPRVRLEPKPSGELADNRIGAYWHGLWPATDLQGWAEREMVAMGITHGRMAINELDCGMVDWSRSEFYVDPCHDALVDYLLSNGISLTYILSFWDKAHHPQGWEPSQPRFTSEEDIRRANLQRSTERQVLCPQPHHASRHGLDDRDRRLEQWAAGRLCHRPEYMHRHG